VLFPRGGAIDLFAVVVSVVAFVGLLKFKWDVMPVIFASAALGCVYRLAF